MSVRLSTSQPILKRGGSWSCDKLWRAQANVSVWIPGGSNHSDVTSRQIRKRGVYCHNLQYNLGPAPPNSLLEKTTEFTTEKSGQQLARTFCTKESTELLYHFLWYRCILSNGMYRKLVQNVRAFSVGLPNFLYIFCGEVQIFFQCITKKVISNTNDFVHNTNEFC